MSSIEEHKLETKSEQASNLGKQILKLLRLTFLRSSRSEKLTIELQAMDSFLKTKSWLVHCLLMIFRVALVASGQTNLQLVLHRGGDKEHADAEHSNRLWRPQSGNSSESLYENAMLGVLYSGTILGVILDILIWRKRRAANALIYYELANFMIEGLCPLDYGDFRQFTLLATVLLTFIAVACGNLTLCAILSTSCQAVRDLIISPLMQASGQ